MQSTNLKKTPVGEIVAENYHVADVFRQYGIDFCCGGHKTLEEVTSKNGVSADEITEQLEQVLTTSIIDSEDYSNWSPEFLIDYIENTHHKFVRTKVPQILAYASKVAKVHGDRHPKNIEIFNLFNLLSQELMEHLSDEEENVFPLIKEYATAKHKGDDSLMDSSVFESALNKLVADHEQAGDLVAQIRKLSNDFTPPEDACTTYRILYQNLEGFEQDLHKHVHLENNILFKKAEALVES